MKDRVRLEITMTKAEAEGLRAAAIASGLSMASTMRFAFKKFLYERDFKKAIKQLEKSKECKK